MEKFELEKVYKCTVDRIKPTYVVLQIDGGLFGICHISEISDYRVNNIGDLFEEKKEYYFQLIEMDEANKKYVFSYKRINPKLLKKHYKIIPSASGFDRLKEQTLDLIKK